MRLSNISRNFSSPGVWVMLTPFLLSDCMMSYFFMVINLVVLSGQGFDTPPGLVVMPHGTQNRHQTSNRT